MKYLYILIALLSNNAYAHDLTKLPLGDGKMSDEPRRGYVWTCGNKVQGIGGGSHKEGPWINKEAMTWDYNKKIFVEGSNKWNNQVSYKYIGQTINIQTNGYPNHNTGDYPIRRGSEAFDYDRNPNPIQEQTITIPIPINPTEQAAQCSPNIIGIMTSGIILLNALDEPKRDAPAHEIQDKCDGHPQQLGIYHYHNISRCLKDEKDKEGHSPILGYAIDGFGIYGKYSQGKKLSNEDLDECHGHKHEITWNGKKKNMYHYHGTDEYPYTIGCLKGQYDIQTIREIMRPNQQNFPHQPQYQNNNQIQNRRRPELPPGFEPQKRFQPTPN